MFFDASVDQVVGSVAYDTERIPFVDKVVELGNIFLPIGESKVFGVVGIEVVYQLKLLILQMTLQIEPLSRQILSRKLNMISRLLLFYGQNFVL